MRSIKELITSPIGEEFSDSEIAHLVKVIQDSRPGSPDNLSVLISLLGTATIATEEYRKLVEKYLYYPSDPWVSAMSLKVLCNAWGLTADYLSEVKQFIIGVKWDVSDETRLIAISIAGSYLRKAFDKELLQLLLLIYEDIGQTEAIHETTDDARSFLQGCAYEALARAAGKDWDEIPSVDEIQEYVENKQYYLLDSEVVQKAHKLIKE